MPSLIDRLTKPEYFFRPYQCYLRVLRTFSQERDTFQTLQLPWGTPIKLNISENIGRSVWYLGLYELVVSETLWRLIDPGERVADVGANYGYMTNLMAVRSGPKGSVISFEPHPVLFDALKENVALTQSSSVPFAPISLFNVGLSNLKGKAWLCLPDSFETNKGTAFLVKEKGQSTSPSLSIDMERFDSFLNQSNPPAVMKIDVEGAELDVLRGAGEYITQRKIRDIIFEEHNAYPTPVTTYLESANYTLFQLGRSLWGPCLLPANTPKKLDVWEPTNFIASADPNRLLERMKPRGWKCLKKSTWDG